MNGRGQADTLDEIAGMPKNILTPEDVCGYLECDKYSINLACKAGTLPWAYLKGSRVIIPKEAFVWWHRYGEAKITESGLFTADVRKAAQAILREELGEYMLDRTRI